MCALHTMKPCRNYVITYNNYPSTELLDDLDCVYMAYSHEIAPTTGTPHLQGFCRFKNAKTLSAVIKLLPGCHIEQMKGTWEQNKVYCSKKGTQELIERGTPPLFNDDKGRCQQLRYFNALEAAKVNDLDTIDPDMITRHYSTYKRIAMDYMTKPEPLDGTCGLWISGPPGSGKSHAVITQWPDRYIKPLNKWWDGYQGEEVVHLDEPNPLQCNNAYWPAYFKLWADKWPFMCEYKGGSRQIRPKKLIVTSNYTIEQMGFNEIDTEAIKRRFVQVDKSNKGQTIFS